MQSTLVELGVNVSIDGVMGTQTLSAINSFEDQVLLYNTFKSKRKDYYDNIKQRRINRYLTNHANTTESDLLNNTLKRFKNGWTNRINGFKDKTKANDINVNC